MDKLIFALWKREFVEAFMASEHYEKLPYRGQANWFAIYRRACRAVDALRN